MQTPVDMGDDDTYQHKGHRLGDEVHHSRVTALFTLLCAVTAIDSPLDAEDGEDDSRKPHRHTDGPYPPRGKEREYEGYDHRHQQVEIPPEEPEDEEVSQQMPDIRMTQHIR